MKTSLQDRLLLFQSGGGRLKIIYQNKRAREVLSANTNINSSRTIAAADRLLLFAAVATCVKRDRETETKHAVVSTKNFRLQVPCFKKLRFKKKKVKTNTNTEVKKRKIARIHRMRSFRWGKEKRTKTRKKTAPSVFSSRRRHLPSFSCRLFRTTLHTSSVNCLLNRTVFFSVPRKTWPSNKRQQTSTMRRNEQLQARANLHASYHREQS